MAEVPGLLGSRESRETDGQEEEEGGCYDGLARPKKPRGPKERIPIMALKGPDKKIQASAMELCREGRPDEED